MEAVLGRLEVTVVSASGLLSADLTGKSDPYVVLDFESVLQKTSLKKQTLTPVWNEDFSFDITDVSSVLHLRLFDHDSFGEPEFLGRLAVPVLKVPCKSGVIQTLGLKNKRLEKRAKGENPRITLRLAKVWNPGRALYKACQPLQRVEVKGFNRVLLVRNVQRVRVILEDIKRFVKFVQSCFEWTNPGRSAKALVAFVVVTYNFEVFMIPLAILAYMFLSPGYKSRSDEDCDHVLETTEILEGEEDVHGESEEEEEEDNTDSRSVANKIRAIPETLVYVQECVGFIASTIESLWNTINFSVPFLSWFAVAFLTLATFILWTIPLRWLVMMWGLNKFTKKLRNPKHVASSELLNYLTRVPDNPTLNQCYNQLEPMAVKMESSDKKTFPPKRISSKFFRKISRKLSPGSPEDLT